MKVFALALAISSALAAIEGCRANELDPLQTKSVRMDSILVKLVEDYATYGDAMLQREGTGGLNGVPGIPNGLLVSADGRAVVEVSSVEPDTPKLVMVLEELGANITGCFSFVQGVCSAMIRIPDLPLVASNNTVRWIGANLVSH
jgi:hypothetical protein